MLPEFLWRSFYCAGICQGGSFLFVARIDFLIGHYFPPRSLLTWTVTVGSVVAHKTPHRDYYISLLRGLLSTSELSFEDFKSIDLKMILWYESAFDVAGEVLWSEVQSGFKSLHPHPFRKIYNWIPS
jgi:hypothetical protein